MDALRDQRAQPSVNVTGAAGLGRSAEAERLRRGFGLALIVDEGGEQTLPRLAGVRLPPRAALILTAEPLNPMHRIRSVPLAAALQQIEER